MLNGNKVSSDFDLLPMKLNRIVFLIILGNSNIARIWNESWLTEASSYPRSLTCIYPSHLLLCRRTGDGEAATKRIFVSVDRLLCGLSFHSQCFQVMPEYLFSL